MFMTPASDTQSQPVDNFANTSRLCGKCELVRNWLQDRGRSGCPKIELHTFKTHGSGPELIASAKRGCHLCAIVVEILDRETHRGERTGEAKIIDHAAWIRLNWITSSRGEGALEIQTSQQDGNSGPRLPVRPLKGKDRHLRPSALARWTGSDAAYETAIAWLKDCLDNHTSCREGHEHRYMPKRLLDLGGVKDKQNVRLVELRADSTSVPYVTLSYCWGRNAGLKLTESTKTLFSRGIASGGIPRTISDAIQVTRRLGFRYLWVDSLCIVQDDKADWEVESASMSDIYANSTFTIAAVGAGDNGRGLFAQREPLAVVPCLLFQDSKGTDYYVDNMEVDMDYVFTRDAPLYGRGWVLQERFLSRRTLGYGARTITWDCREELVSDTFVIQHQSIEGPKRRFKREMHKGRACALRNLLLTTSAQKFALEQEALDIWNEIVSDYSRTALSFETDKMIAIRGLIAVFENITGWQNVYGLWQPYFLNQLLWSPRHRLTEPAQSTGSVAPSWSWACSTGKIEYESYASIGFMGKTRVFAAEFDMPSFPSPPANGEKYNSSFVLVLRSYMFQAQIRPADTDHGYDKGNKRIDVTRGSINYEMGSLLPDWKDIPEQCSFVPLCLDEESMMTQLLGLCVRRSTAPTGVYERVGMAIFTFWGYRQMDLSVFSNGGNRETLRLV